MMCERHAMKLSFAASKRKHYISFVLHTAGCEHHHLSTRRMFTYVVGVRVGLNDTCYFSFDM